MIEKGNVIAVIMTRLKRLPVGEHLDVRSYKRDRSIVIIRQQEDTLRIIERGFHEEEFTVQTAQLKKLLRTIVKREFPRSNKLRIYDLGPYEEFAPRLKRKRI